MSTIKSKHFSILVKTLTILATIALVLTSLSMLPIIIAIIALLIIPSSFINSQLDKANKPFWVDSLGLNSHEITKHDLNSITFPKPSVILMLLLIIVLIAIYILVITYVRKWLKNVSRGQIFTDKNANIIILISYCFIVLGVFEAFIELASNFMVYNFLGQNAKLYALIDKDIETFADFFFNFNFTLILAGIVIWIIGNVFKYCAFLQDEFDYTV
ncbi:MULTISPECIES: DUF2975 domain-containing protein [Staphylococcus]|uniref:DUF2975 domain-containing protein n=1 Tax=Staphylococcus TaxID=1279 RepID=UPI0015E5C961|nr:MULTISPECIES: DUF2975 domain-containing protein [Staphylococcus]MBA1353180.1 DUF2975 domain-containing protein [Staphylococcus cohnii]MBA1389912.1 DUF2975 domain-containing protein [Staphylococcus cohnii]